MARHHFVAQGFLRGFAANERRSNVWVYDKRPDQVPELRAIKSIGWLSNYYAQERDDGTLDNAIEDALARSTDNNAPRIIQRINARPGGRVHLTVDDRAEMARFVGLSLTRVPSFRDGIDEWHRDWAEFVRDPEFIDPGGEFAAAVPRDSLRAMVTAAKAIAHSLVGKAWQFCIPPPNVPLATSDNPVIFSGGFAKLANIGPEHPGAEVVMNLRSDLALVCSPRDMSTDCMAYQMSGFDARKFTRGVVQAARHRVFYSRRDDNFDALVKKYPDEGQRLRGERQPGPDPEAKGAVAPPV